jgi:hypothetical protein
MVHQFLVCRHNFFYFRLNYPSGTAKHGLLCAQFADSAGKLQPGFLIQTQLQFLLVLPEFKRINCVFLFFFILYKNENIHVSAPRGIILIFAECKNVLLTACKILKIREN